jgi:hypothetical protein
MNQQEMTIKEEYKMLDDQIKVISDLLQKPQGRFKRFILRIIPASVSSTNQIHRNFLKLTLGFLALSKQTLAVIEHLDEMADEDDEDDGGMYA